jgi:hypothetical protein
LSFTFIRPKGIESAKLSFHSSPSHPGKARIAAKAASIPLRVPAMVPLIPSGASSSDPRTPCASQTSRSPGFRAAGSGKLVK